MMDKQEWNATIAQLPNPHLLQTWEWGEVKAQYGWQPFYRIWRDEDKLVAAALVLEREVKLSGVQLGLRMHYTPKGPLLMDWADVGLRQRVLKDLAVFARQRSAFLLKIDPDVPVGFGEPDSEEDRSHAVGLELVEELSESGWRFSDEQIQFRNTVLIDLENSEEDLLMSMKSKTRYNVRLAGRKGVTVRRGGMDDLEMLYAMYAETAIRDGFTIRSKEYYLTVWQTFLTSEMLTPLIAEVEGNPVAGLMLFTFGKTARYIYGMSKDEHRNLMPTYLIQWEAIRLAKEKGCTVYDLWGAPDEFTPNDSMWGVYRFKKGLGGQVVRTIGAWDLPLRPWVFKLYSQVWPRVMGILRARGRAQTRQALEGDN
ncbi:MAG: peptidoglycan bridge formation glycyltransferase FemA/FemB family protein [Anaerolineales bacterium]